MNELSARAEARDMKLATTRQAEVKTLGQP